MSGIGSPCIPGLKTSQERVIIASSFPTLIKGAKLQYSVGPRTGCGPQRDSAAETNGNERSSRVNNRRESLEIVHHRYHVFTGI